MGKSEKFPAILNTQIRTRKTQSFQRTMKILKDEVIEMGEGLIKLE